MDYAAVSAAGQAAGDIGTSLAATCDQTAHGCTAAARAFPGWATSQVLADLHQAHTSAISGHIDHIRSTAAGIEGSVDLTAAADSAPAGGAFGPAGT